MHLLNRARKLIDDSLKTAKNPCILWSGGMDSSLVLKLIQEFAEIDILHFKMDVDGIEKLLMEQDLEVTMYPPANRYFVPNEHGLSLVDEYSFNGLVPLIRDFVEGEKCSLELGDARVNLNFPYDTVFTGVLKGDTHFLTGDSPFGKEEISENSGVRFIHPLMSWTKDEVKTMVRALDVKYAEGTGEIGACTNCLTGNTYCPKVKQDIPLIEWDPAKNLRDFRARFNFYVS